jgi:hypothetical protein
LYNFKKENNTLYVEVKGVLTSFVKLHRSKQRDIIDYLVTANLKHDSGEDMVYDLLSLIDINKMTPEDLENVPDCDCLDLQSVDSWEDVYKY